MTQPKLLLGGALLIALASGCAHYDRRQIARGSQPAFGHLRIDDYNFYLIDSRTETCAWHHYTDAVVVDCAKLRKNVPEAADLITWVVESKAVGTSSVSR